MRYYSSVKKCKIMKFTNKWNEVEFIIASNVTQIQKDKWLLFIPVDVSFKSLDVCDSFGIFTKNRESVRCQSGRGIHGMGDKTQ